VAALEELGIGRTTIIVAFAILFGGVAASVAIAFGLAARDLARKNLEAEQRKYELGAQTIFFVLEAQQRASDAELQLLAATVAYKKAVVAVERASNTLVADNNVVIEQALAGR